MRNPIKLLNNVALTNPNFQWDLKKRTLQTFRVLDRNNPWLYPHNELVRDQTNKCFNCQFLFHQLKCMPYIALDCWKVVIPIHKIEDLSRLYRFMCNDSRPYCKLGMETRSFVKSRKYGGYYYHTTKEAGLETKYALRKELAEHFGREMEVFLKRGCTEYEIDVGPSNTWDEICNEEEIKFQKEVLSYTTFDLDESDTAPPQEEYQKQMTMAGWMDWAKKVEMEYIRY